MWQILTVLMWIVIIVLMIAGSLFMVVMVFVIADSKSVISNKTKVDIAEKSETA